MVLVSAGTLLLLAEGANNVFILPRLCIPRWSRTVRELQIAAKSLFGIGILILNTTEPTSNAAGLLLQKSFAETTILFH